VPFLVEGSELPVTIVKGVAKPKPAVKPAVLPATGVADALSAGAGLLTLALAGGLVMRRSRA
jgi:LPXTG-motif cell wall-anchored protein